MSAATHLPDWIALRAHATEIRRTIRKCRCEVACEPDRDERDQVTHPGYPRCTEAHPDAPGKWCEPCQARATARAELAMVKRQIASVERTMMRVGVR